MKLRMGGNHNLTINNNNINHKHQQTYKQLKYNMNSKGGISVS